MAIHVPTRHNPSHDPAPAVVPASLTFVRRSAEKPYSYEYGPPPGVAAPNTVPEARTVMIEDARAIDGELSLDVQGLAVVRHRSAVRDFRDEAQALALGHPEAAQLVKDVHVDQTDASGPRRVRDITDDQARALLAGRAAIINVWRPIGHPARDWPLAGADAQSIGPRDLIASDLIFRHRKGEIYTLAHNPAQRWRYIPDLAPDEAILIRCWTPTPGSPASHPTPPSRTPRLRPAPRRARA
jgi:hypothetical protein